MAPVRRISEGRYALLIRVTSRAGTSTVTRHSLRF
jgi:hypothetical protein